MKKFINEALTNYNIKSTIVKGLLDQYPKKYKPHSNSSRIKSVNNDNGDELSSDIEAIAAIEGIKVISIDNYPPGKSTENSKALSNTFNTLWITLEGFKPFCLIPTSIGGRNKTSTNFKEGLVCFFASCEQVYDPIKKTNKDKEINYIQLLERIIVDMRNSTKLFLNKHDKEEIIEFLVSKSEKFDLGILNAIMNSMSVGNWIKNSELNGWEIRMDDFFKTIKREGSLIAGIPADKWNPMDLMAIRPDTEKDILNEISKIKSETNKDIKLDMFNSLFCDNIDTPENDKFIIAISVKEQSAQHGKAKSMLSQLDKDEYNLSNTEKTWVKEEGKLLKEITKLREQIKEELKTNSNANDIFLYKLAKDTNKYIGSNLFGKYGSLKMLLYLIKQTTKKDNIFKNLASTGLSIGYNPTFFKLMGNIGGNHDTVGNNLMEFPKMSTVELYDAKHNDYDGKIWLLDNDTNAGIKIIYWIIFSNYVYIVDLLIRSNQPENKLAQVTIEIEKFVKLKEI